MTRTFPRLVEAPEDVLPGLLEERASLSQALRAVDQQIAEQGRLLAKRRGVAFIRVERLKQEFGPSPIEDRKP
jgi:hypothetical protein